MDLFTPMFPQTWWELKAGVGSLRPLCCKFSHKSYLEMSMCMSTVEARTRWALCVCRMAETRPATLSSLCMCVCACQIVFVVMRCWLPKLLAKRSYMSCLEVLLWRRFQEFHAAVLEVRDIWRCWPRSWRCCEALMRSCKRSLHDLVQVLIRKSCEDHADVV